MIKNIYIGTLKTIWNRPLCASMIVFFAIFGSFVAMYFFSNGDPLSDDHYFHFRYAQLLRTDWSRAVDHFDWIYLSGHGKEGGSRYAVNLYQISLIPFTYFSNELFALHVVDAFFASMVFALFYFLLRKNGVRHALLCVLLLFGFSYFLSRMLYGRAFVLITGLIFLELFLAVEKRYRALFFISVFHILWHQSTFFIPLVVGSVVEMARYLVYQRFYFKNMITIFLGVVVGMAFYPGFPLSMIKWSKAIFSIQADATLNENVVSIGGKELFAKDFMNQMIFAETLVTLFIFCVVSVIFIYITTKKQREDLTFNAMDKKKIFVILVLFIWMIIMMLGSISISGRVFDFFVPSVYILTGLLISFFVEKKILSINKSFQSFVMTGIWIFTLVFFTNSFISVYADANSLDFQPVQKSAAWIEENSEGHRDKVFLYNWGLFNMMFFANSHNVYSMGVEPMALKNYDESLYWKYYNIYRLGYYCELEHDCTKEFEKEREFMTSGGKEIAEQMERENAKKIVQSIKNDFGARFIVSDSRDFTRAVELNPQLIDKKYHVQSDRVTGKLSEITVFKLK